MAENNIHELKTSELMVYQPGIEPLFIDEENFFEEILVKEGDIVRKLTRADFLIETIIKSDEFNKLGDCTQSIFDEAESYVTNNRLTHTITVSEVAYAFADEAEIIMDAEQRTIDEELIEFVDGKYKFIELGKMIAKIIALLHDVGHVVFGHRGETRMDVALRYGGATAQEYNDAYMAVNSLGIKPLQKRGGEVKHVFEHHAQSVRVAFKILQGKNIYLSPSLRDIISLGIYCHSESRVAILSVISPMAAIPRCSDKIYTFTDVQDILKALENDFSIDSLENILKDKNFASVLEKRDINIEEGDIETIKEIFRAFLTNPDALTDFKAEYVRDSKIIYGDGGWVVKQNDEVVRKMRILQALVSYMRLTKLIGKEERLADAMIDELIMYKVEHAEKDEEGNFIKSKKDRIIDACLFVGELKDTEVRILYSNISQDKTWVEQFDSVGNYDIAEYAQEMVDEIVEPKKVIGKFPRKLLKNERDLLRKNPNIILNYYFRKEILEIKDEEIRDKMFLKLMFYRSNPTLEMRNELINEIERAKKKYKEEKGRDYLH